MCGEDVEEDNLEKSDLNLTDPLQGVNNDVTEPLCYRVNETVFAEPFKTVTNKQIGTRENNDEILFIDNIVVLKSSGRKYKKYLFNIEDGSSSCPQKECAQTFSTTKLLKAHIRKTHCAHKTYMCEQCGAGFKAQYLLARHLAVHSEEKVQCSVCSKMLSVRTNMAAHMRIHMNAKKRNLPKKNPKQNGGDPS